MAGAFFGVIFGYVTTKKAGTTFAMISLGIGEMVFASSLMFSDFFGGEAGISTNRVIGGSFLGVTYGPSLQVYYLIVGWALVCMAAMFAWTQTPLGRMANAVRDPLFRAAVSVDGAPTPALTDAIAPKCLSCHAPMAEGRSLADWLDASFQPYPQLLVNVTVPDRRSRQQWQLCEPLRQAVEQAESAMQGQGRVLVRASGTEPLLRVMVEASEPAAVAHWAERLAGLAAQHLNPA